MTLCLALICGLTGFASAQAAPCTIERIYTRVDENGTVCLTNRPDGDERYRLLGQFQVQGMGMFDVKRTVQQLAPEGMQQLVTRYARAHGVDAGLIMAIIKTESNGVPTAVSPAGAQGLMQLMPGTQQDLNVQDAFDPEENIAGGVRYFCTLLKRYKTVDIALAAYNAGAAAVDTYGGIPPFPETQNYVRRVRSLYQPD
ncbi:MAG: lytic transglycosylase domain-containing protein [Bilophila sp.]